MSPDDIGNIAGWVCDLTGCEWPRLIDTGKELLEYLLYVEEHFADQLTGSELEDVRGYISTLRRDGKEVSHEELMAISEWWERQQAKTEHRKSLYIIGAAAKRRKGLLAREEIIRKYNSLRLPTRDRAAHIATVLGLSPQHVRRILRKERQKTRT
jgi:hypothetical protein